MFAEWSVECGVDDPDVMVPWADPAAPPDKPGARFIDLRGDSDALDHIPEAEQHAPLLEALRALNATRSPVFTAKCDAWTCTPEEVATMQFDLDRETDPSLVLSGFASYIDLIWRERSTFASFHQQEQMMHRLVRHAEVLDQPLASLACVLRPAMVDLTAPHQGFAVTMYVRALGDDEASAYAGWASALKALVAIIRSKDLSFA